ncbi:MAG: hypothetical protein Q8L87_14185 [Anaerolineales bacterium]|nr:hypothetical protein [Anaerolineales bacterium]
MKKYFAILLALLLVLGVVIPASAQSYSFRLDKMTVDVYWNADGSMALDYFLTFTNQAGASPIDFVDVGLPNSSYTWTSINASVNGESVSVSTDYQGSGTGVAVDLGSRAIQPGQTGVVRLFVGRIERVIYNDDDDETYASAVFSPTWFGSQYVVGSTNLTVVYHLPPGVQPEEPRWHSAPSGFPSEPQTGFDNDGRITYTWNNANASGSAQYKFGASFPKIYIPETAIVTAPPFDFNAFFSSIMDVLMPILCFGLVTFFMFIAPIIGALNERKRKLQYLPPRIAIEGHGVKRGLTAVEAALLLEQPLDKVMTMILFGVIKKGAAKVSSRDPLKVEAIEPLPEKLHDYEKKFLDAFKETNGKSRQKMLQTMMAELVKATSEKLRGFSRKETVGYYKAITEKAWAMVETENTPEVKSQKYEEALEWTMLDKDYDDRTRRTFTGPVIVPRWWGNYNPTYKTASPSAPTPAPASKGGALPGADFAAQMVTGVQTFSQKAIGNVQSFTESITKTTNPPPKPSSSGRSGGSGGRSCACACACAGCACACAGGGR